MTTPEMLRAWETLHGVLARMPFTRHMRGDHDRQLAFEQAHAALLDATRRAAGIVEPNLSIWRSSWRHEKPVGSVLTLSMLRELLDQETTWRKEFEREMLGETGVEKPSWRDRIGLDFDVAEGYPHVKSAGVSVAVIVGMRALGIADEKILRRFPGLEPEDLQAVTDFVAARPGAPGPSMLDLMGDAVGSGVGPLHPRARQDEEIIEYRISTNLLKSTCAECGTGFYMPRRWHPVSFCPGCGSARSRGGASSEPRG